VALLDGKEFCSDTNAVAYTSFRKFWIGAANQAWAGPRHRDGFSNYWDRVSFAARFDGGAGLTRALPFAREVPLFGGWVVAKATVLPDSRVANGQNFNRWALDALYTPSDSRVADWYLAAGREQWRNESGELVWGTAGELGFRFRFNVGVLHPLPFIGGRIGLPGVYREYGQPERHVDPRRTSASRVRTRCGFLVEHTVGL
jgi:hypothetical protein